MSLFVCGYEILSPSVCHLSRCSTQPSLVPPACHRKSAAILSNRIDIPISLASYPLAPYPEIILFLSSTLIRTFPKRKWVLILKKWGTFRATDSICGEVGSGKSIILAVILRKGPNTKGKLYCKPITLADREMVEEKAHDIISKAQDGHVAFLVVRDPLGATTHTDLVVRANKMGIDVKIVHNASVMNVIGICGLLLYRYGETVSIPFFTETGDLIASMKRYNETEIWDFIHSVC